MFKRNIAFLEAESTSLSKIAWSEHLKLVNEVWVPNSDLGRSLRDDMDFTLPIYVVHHPTDYNRYTKKYPEITIPQLENKFVFYYIGDLNDRKNIDSIVTCFHSEFDKSEPVGLLLKIKKFGKSPEEIRQIMDARLTQVKNSLRMYPNISNYARDVVISEDASDENICSLHQHCDCFVCPSHGEAWSLPTFDAMAFGSSPIASDYGGPAEFFPSPSVNETCGTLVGGVYSVCKCSDAAFPDIFTGREYWFQPCEMEIRNAMREKYENHKQDPLATKRSWKLDGLKQAKKFTYEAIGKRMKEILSESSNTAIHQ
jgi:glycosyltransferase involved in cell wall biosynthesis